MSYRMRVGLTVSHISHRLTSAERLRARTHHHHWCPLCWESGALCLALEGSLEFPNRMRFFDREPFSVTLVGAGRAYETNHLALRVVRIATPLLEASLKLDTTANASQL